MVRLIMEILDVPATQAWLEDWAARGQFLERLDGWARFVPGTPDPGVRYRLQPAREASEKPEEITEYRAMGWEYVCTGKGYHVWRCCDPAAPELDTDPVVQGEGYRYQLRRYRRESLLMGLGLLLLGAVVLWTHICAPREMLLRDSRVINWHQLLLWLYPAFYVLVFLWRNWSIRRFARRLKMGIAIPQRHPYRWDRLRSALLWAVPIGLLFLRLPAAAYQTERPYQPLSAYDGPVPYVSLTALDPREEPAGEPQVRDIRNRLVNEVWQVQEYAKDSENYCSTDFYDIRSVRQAEGLVKQLLKKWRDLGSWTEETLEVPAGLDEAWYLTYRSYSHGFRQVLLARRESRVVFVYYLGGGNLRESLGQYEALLAPS